jgi:Family of unknown function (DUF6152)
MKRGVLTWICALTISISSIHGRAHHSLSGSYEMNREITIEGLVTVFQFINPHPFVTVSVESPRGEKQQWRAELDNRSELVDIGMTSETFKPGDRVIIVGNPGHDKAQTIYVRRLNRPSDGLKYEQPDTTPSIQIPNKR